MDLHGIEDAGVVVVSWVAELDVRLVGVGQLGVEAGAFAVRGPMGREIVQHDALSVKVSRRGLVEGVQSEHVVVDHLSGPVVGRPAKVLVDCLLIPGNLSHGALVLMDGA